MFAVLSGIRARSGIEAGAHASLPETAACGRQPADASLRTGPRHTVINLLWITNRGCSTGRWMETAYPGCPGAP
jgi:hypothetical protein